MKLAGSVSVIDDRVTAVVFGFVTVIVKPALVLTGTDPTSAVRLIESGAMPKPGAGPVVHATAPLAASTTP